MPISFDTTFEDYQRLSGVHFSALKAMAISPKHYRRAVDAERADTAALALGRLTHALILEIAPDLAVWSGKKVGKAWAEFRAQATAEGKTIVRADELRRSYAMREAVLANPHARALLEQGAPEVTVTWEEQIATAREDIAAALSPVSCRARLDWLGPHGLVEVKTTRRSLVQRSWAREVATYAYHVQLAHYAVGLEANGEMPDMPAHWIVVESAPPYDVAVYRLRREDLEAGERLRLTWLRRVAECEAAGVWPGVGADGPLECALPDYATTEGLPEVDMNELERADDGDAAEQ